MYVSKQITNLKREAKSGQNIILYMNWFADEQIIKIIGEHGIGEYGIGEHGIGEYGIGEYGIGEYGIGEHGIGEHGIGEYGIGEYEKGEYGIGEIINCLKRCKTEVLDTSSWSLKFTKDYSWMSRPRSRPRTRRSSRTKSPQDVDF